MNETFTLAWKNAASETPDEYGDFWCYIKKPGKDGFEYEKTTCHFEQSWWRSGKWTKNGEEVTVLSWTELPPIPHD